jgi:uncharacterized protein (TIRG00374 family)
VTTVDAAFEFEDVAAVPEIGRRARLSGRKVWRAIRVPVFVALIAVEVALLFPSLSHAADSLAAPDPWWFALAIACQLVSMRAYARVARRMLAAGGPRVSVCKIEALTYAAHAMSISLPGGAVASTTYQFRRIRSWGASVPVAGFTVASSAVLSTIAFALLTIACSILAGDGGFGSIAVIAIVAAVALIVVVVHRRGRAGDFLRVGTYAVRQVNRVMRREPDAGVEALQRFAHDVTAIKPRSRDWIAGLSYAVLNWLADLACLFACCRAVDADRTTLLIVSVAYLAGMSAASFTVVPGGFGIVDAAMILALTGGGVGTVAATASVVLYRLVSFALVAALGWIAWGATRVVDRRRLGVAVAVAD